MNQENRNAGRIRNSKILFLGSCFPDLPVFLHNKKAMRGKRMAEKSYLYLAPFGGITRIRFKGFVQDVSANSAPPLSRKG